MEWLRKGSAYDSLVVGEIDTDSLTRLVDTSEATGTEETENVRFLERNEVWRCIEGKLDFTP